MESPRAPLDPELPRNVQEAFAGAFAVLKVKLDMATPEASTWGDLTRALEHLVALASKAHRTHANQPLSVEDLADESLDCFISDPALARALELARERKQALSPVVLAEAKRAYKREELEARRRMLQEQLAYFNRLAAE